MSSTLIELRSGAYYLPSAANVGVIATPKDGAILIDTGSDKSHARRVVEACQVIDLRPRAIITTHHHADHCGGNGYLVRNLNIPVYAPPLESAIVSNTILEPFYLFGGAMPIDALRDKWLMAPASPVAFELEAGTVEINRVELDIIPIPGHAPGMMAVGYEDVCYCVDGLFGPDILEKYGIPFTADVAQQLDSIERLRSADYEMYLPAHGEPTDDIDALAAANCAAIERAIEAVHLACSPAGELSEILARVADLLDLNFENIPKFYLMQTTVAAYLAYLTQEGRVAPWLEDNRLWWHQV
ncbi:MAG: Hydroxyacylglutathione hydrolase GloC [Anaerolineales bacterium]|nr:Hydroxyacylglutathione hydrolase GloC [Anaerolineales bacterium]